MITIDKTEVFGWESAIRGMRNPLNSWDKSDSHQDYYDFGHGRPADYLIGDNDLKLMKTLSKAGPDHGKFLRMINVACDINAPLYWWKEFDTYKVGTVANSCSTMHKIHAKEFVLDDFSYDQLLDEYLGIDSVANMNVGDSDWTPLDVLVFIKDSLNHYRKLYMVADEKLKNRELTEAERRHITSQRKRFWWQMIQLLPSSYNQKRTVQFNYQVLKNMYNARKSHKLDEWHKFCTWCESLPYFKEICLGGDNNEE